MKYVIHGRQPESVFRFFEEISAIPHPSYHEERVADYLVAFARERGLFCYRDRWNNVLIRRPADQGKETLPALIFQGHTDMVAEKNRDAEHDFLNDPLELFVDGKFLRAKGTTLGGDNGIAVAMMLAILDGEIPNLPTVECLFTTCEEVGLEGASNFDTNQITATRMVNLDSELLGEVVAGCSGGVRSDLLLTASTEPFSGVAVKVEIGGLAGGHSGNDINKKRANANKLLGAFLAKTLETYPIRVVSLSGGSKDNAIPREAAAVIAAENPVAVIERLTEAAEEAVKNLSPEDYGFSFSAEEEGDVPTEMFSKAATLSAVSVLNDSRNGVLSMCREIPDLVEYSRNLGVVTTEENTVKFVFSSRSAVDAQLDASMEELDDLAKKNGCTVKHHSRYPGWEYAKKSPLRDAYLQAYSRVVGEDAKVTVIHAGLECGILHGKMPDCDVISVGPTMHDIHSPNEKLDLDAVELFWKTLVRLTEILK